MIITKEETGILDCCNELTMESLTQNLGVVETLNARGTKYDGGKLPLNLLSTTALYETAKVLAHGAKKYGVNNWRQGIEWSRVIAAALRHLTAFNNGDNFDTESGLSHLSHAACCIMFLQEYVQTHPQLDDRYKGNNESKNSTMGFRNY